MVRKLERNAAEMASLLGFHADKLKYHDHLKAHYANAAVDIEFEFPFGFKELEGIHSRTDYDLTQHQNILRQKVAIFRS